MEILIKKGVDVNARDKYGRTPLILAAEHKNPEIREILIKHGAK
ncbi:MAG: ankyrin repeat domain-containing protein [Synergistaceae bacterium]|nr:ankyrin repeat domain-containing protein [Synergistaceae bacterium]